MSKEIIEEFKALPYCQPPLDNDYLECPSCHEKDFVCKGCASNWLIKALKKKETEVKEEIKKKCEGMKVEEGVYAGYTYCVIGKEYNEALTDIINYLIK